MRPVTLLDDGFATLSGELDADAAEQFDARVENVGMAASAP